MRLSAVQLRWKWVASSKQKCGRATTSQGMVSLIAVMNCSAGPSAVYDADVEVHQEEHLIPLVPAIVVKVDAQGRRLYIQPPKGLLELGRRKCLLTYLKSKLQVNTCCLLGGG